MQIIKPSTVIVLDSRRPKKNGLYPIKIRVTYLREVKYYSIGEDLSKEYFAIMGSNSELKSLKNSDIKKRIISINERCSLIKAKALMLIDEMQNFNFERFERMLFTEYVNNNSVYVVYDTQILKLTKEQRIGTALNYSCSRNSLKSFSTNLKFSDVSVNFLKSYESWLIENGKSISTVGFYLRPLRAIFNEAMSQEIISKDIIYPFGKGKYQIPTTRNIKKALTRDEIKKIYYYQPMKGTWWEKAKDFFLFSYLANGMNIKDILLLKGKNIDKEYIRFRRAKTLNTSRENSNHISIYLSDDIKLIIEKWGSKNPKAEEFIFPILTNDLNMEEQHKQIHQFTKMINRYLNDVTKSIGIDKKVTTYYARHSFATILKQSGKSTEMISESLGHSSIKTTKSYLDSFGDEEWKNISTCLTDFKTF